MRAIPERRSEVTATCFQNAARDSATDPVAYTLERPKAPTTSSAIGPVCRMAVSIGKAAEAPSRLMARCVGSSMGMTASWAEDSYHFFANVPAIPPNKPPTTLPRKSARNAWWPRRRMRGDEDASRRGERGAARASVSIESKKLTTGR